MCNCDCHTNVKFNQIQEIDWEPTLQEAKEAFEYILDVAPRMPNDVIYTLASEGGGIEIDGKYFGDDEAGVAHHTLVLCKYLETHLDSMKRE